MKQPKGFMSKKQQWLSFLLGLILLIILFPSFLIFWNSLDNLIKIVFVIILIPIFVLMLFSGKIYKNNPHLFKQITGYDPYELGNKGPSFLIKKTMSRYIKVVLLCLFIGVVGLIIAVLLK